MLLLRPKASPFLERERVIEESEVVAPLQAKSVRVELDQRRDHVVLGQDALGSRRRAKQTFARAARWSAPSHQAA